MNISISELKDLILWAKKEKVSVIKLGDVQFELSIMALTQDLQDLANPEATKDLSVPANSPRLPGGNVQANEDDDEALLFHSSEG